MKRMKRMLSFVLTGLMLLAMAACGAKEQSKVLVYEQSGVVMEYKMDAKGDVIHTITQTSVIDCSQYTEDQILQMEEMIEEVSPVYEEIEGVTYEVTRDGDELKEIITIDASNADALEELSDAGMLPLEGSGQKISLEKTVESLESQGWTVQE